MSNLSAAEEPIVVLIPVFNDWKATEMLLAALDRVLTEHRFQVQVLLVDDASTEPAPENYLQAAARAPEFARGNAHHNGGPTATATSIAPPQTFQALTRIDILELRRNLGHQRAIAIGLAHIHANQSCQAVLIMDGDGEDDPHDVPRLIEAYCKHGRKKIVFARRSLRSESALFRICYALYRVLHYVLTGQGINVGNFSIVPFESINRLVAVTELWNHYAAAVFKARLPYETIPTRRAVRLAGEARMNFVGLVIHGLSAISIYGDVVGVRLLLASIAVIVATTVGLLTVVVVRLATEMAIPGWATNAAGLLLVLLFQAIMSSIMFIFIILNNRHGANFLPVRDYGYFVLRTRRITWQQ
jgi:glycosyltransferase involved in cell wall biosynthesis